MNSYLDILGDVLRIVTFQQERSRATRHLPAVQVYGRPYRSAPDRAGDRSPVS